MYTYDTGMCNIILLSDLAVDCDGEFSLPCSIVVLYIDYRSSKGSVSTDKRT